MQGHPNNTESALPRIVILGGGTAGTILANKLARRGNRRLTVIDQNLRHYFQPGLLHYPFGRYRQKDLIRDRRRLLPQSARYFNIRVRRIRPKKNALVLDNGQVIPYDILVIATGVRTAPEETPGLLGPKWRGNIFDFYTFEGALELREKLATWQGGKLVVNINEMPVKCPVAALEFAFLADDYFRSRGIRQEVEISYVTPLSGAFTQPVASRKLGHLLKEKGIVIVADFDIERVDQETDHLVAYDGREVKYDLLVTVPVNKGDDLIARSKMGDELNFVATDAHTLQAKKYPNIFVIGDAAALPISKAGSGAHFQSDTVAANVGRLWSGQPLLESYDGHVNCFLDTGDQRALLIDFSYRYEPQAGKFPFLRIGPLKMLRESHLNYWVKRMLRLTYWRWLMPGRHLPFVATAYRPVPGAGQEDDDD